MTKHSSRVLLASAAIAGCMAFATAAAAAPAPSHDTWTGFYAGLRAGLAAGQSDWSNIVVPSDTEQNLPDRFADPRPTGAVIGIQAGYNYQISQVVLGLEGDVNYTTAAAASRCRGSYGDYSADCRTKVNLTLDLAGRIGIVPMKNVLVYFKGGVAYADSDFSALNETGPYEATTGYGNTGRSDWGYVLGGGVDIALSEHWSVGAEYDYQEFGLKNIPFTPVGTANDYNQPFTADTTLSVNSVVVKVNYKF